MINPHDDDLRTLLSDAVSDVEPTDRLAAIRGRTQVTSLSSRRTWYAAGGGLLATAAAVTVIAVVANTAGGPVDRNDRNGPVDTPTTAEPTTPPASEVVVPIYYVGDSPRGPRLFREQRSLASEGSVEAAVTLLESAPLDPDYRTLWSDDSFGEVSVTPDQIDIVLTDASLRERPADVSKAEAQIAIEQVIRTLQDATGTDAAVQFRYGDNPIDQVLDVPTSEALAPGKVTETLSQMSIDSPTEGEVVSGTFTASGRNNGFEATYEWSIHRGDATGRVVLEGFGTADGWMTERLFDWRTDAIDVSDLEPGTYTFFATNPDPSGGEGFAPDTDTRTIVVE